MSFSSEVKEELAKQLSKSRHCQLAELAAMISFTGRIISTETGHEIEISTEHASLAKKCFTLIKKAFNISADIQTHNSYEVCLKKPQDVQHILQAVKMLDDTGTVETQTRTVNGMLVQNACCRRAFIRGAFLSAGSMSDPQKSYHFEIVCTTMEQAEQLKLIICEFQVDAKIVQRKKYFVVYLKEGAQIVDMLNIMEAHIALMKLENVRIIKEMRNSVNRKVNCETANISKTVNAAVKQTDDIYFIQEKIGLDELPENLKEMALLRLEYPDAPLKELGGYLNPPVGKSGVNHRLRKITSLADDLRS